MSETHLNDLERRLAGWRPATDGLDADAMLFAAGRASVRRGAARFAWPAVAAGLALALGISETGRNAERRHHEVAFARIADAPKSPEAMASSDISSQNYLIVRRSLESNPDGATGISGPPPAPPGEHPMLRAGQRNLEIANY